jgi:hypothetical protein
MTNNIKNDRKQQQRQKKVTKQMTQSCDNKTKMTKNNQ